jgi:hypothetical protein
MNNREVHNRFLDSPFLAIITMGKHLLPERPGFLDREKAKLLVL